MKFGDKLQKVRRENNITQEQLADKLNVTRQSVSKWESGLAYPDTEKLIQISKLFNVSLDELVNDGNDINKQKNRKKKFNFMETFDMIFEAVSKVWKMFLAMKFVEKIKFILEMAFVILAIYLAASLINSVILGIIRRIFAFLPYKIFNIIDYLVYTILYVVWIILGVMFFIRILKVRYLDYYVIVKDDSVDRPVVEEPIAELKARKETKIVIRDPHDSETSIFKMIAKLLIFLFKCLCVLIAIPLVFTFIFLLIILVISLLYLFSGLFFNGISLALFGIILFTYLLIKFIYKVVFNQKINYGKLFIIFILSISLMGIGAGLSFASLNTLDITNESSLTEEVNEIDIKMKDNLVIDEIMDIPDDKFVIDDKMDDIKLVIHSYHNLVPKTYNHMIYSGNDDATATYEMVDINYNYDVWKLYQTVISELKDKQLNVFNYDDYYINKVYISKKNLTKLRENYQKFSNSY